jgi:hypothetical protein
VVLFRLGSPSGDVDRVRTLVLGQAETLPEIFRLACQKLFKLTSLVDDDEYAYCLRITRNDALTAMALLVYDPNQGEIPYRVEWLREPTPDDVQNWQQQTQKLLESSFDIKVNSTESAKESKKLRIKLLHNLVETRHFSMATSMVYPALYAVEREFGLQYAKAQHLTEDIGL